jgi:hypothetical protein
MARLARLLRSVYGSFLRFTAHSKLIGNDRTGSRAVGRRANSDRLKRAGSALTRAVLGRTGVRTLGDLAGGT